MTGSVLVSFLYSIQKVSARNKKNTIMHFVGRIYPRKMMWATNQTYFLSVRLLTWKPVASLKSATCLEYCGCVALASFLGVPSSSKSTQLRRLRLHSHLDRSGPIWTPNIVADRTRSQDTTTGYNSDRCRLCVEILFLCCYHTENLSV
jgi:hypothetical protein